MESLPSWMASVQTYEAIHMVTDGSDNGKMHMLCIWYCFFLLPLPSPIGPQRIYQWCHCHQSPNEQPHMFALSPFVMTKIPLPLPSQCERTFKVGLHVALSVRVRYFHCYKMCSFYCHQNNRETRMHSSRMRTAPAVAIGEVCLSACMDTPPWVWAWRPPPDVGLETPPGVGLETPFPGCGPGDPPGQTPQLPPGCGPGDPPGQTPQLPSWVWAWKPAMHAGISPPETCKACWDTTCNACWDTPPPPWTESQTRVKI